MNKTIRLIQNYLIYALPFVLICMAWGTLKPEKEIISGSFMTRMLWEVFSWNLMLWFAILILFLVSLVVWPLAREKTLKRLANLKDRDEREEYITGKASRAAYISSLSLLIFFLFFSVFSLNIYRMPEGDAINGKTGTVSIGLNFNLLDKPLVETASPKGKILFESKGIPFSKTALLLVLLFWQLLSFNLTARKENMEEPGFTGDKKFFAVLISAGAILFIVIMFKPLYLSLAKFPSLLVKAEKGDADAQNKVGEMFLFGQDIKQDFEEARTWFLKSAAQGDAVAPNHLGRLYLNGEGVQKNVREACKWYHLAAERGDRSGQENASWCDSEDAKKQM